MIDIFATWLNDRAKQMMGNDVEVKILTVTGPTTKETYISDGDGNKVMVFFDERQVDQIPVWENCLELLKGLRNTTYKKTYIDLTCTKCKDTGMVDIWYCPYCIKGRKMLDNSRCRCHGCNRPL